jgi:F0F1-type ATP synthase membrane subunit b/b'
VTDSGQPIDPRAALRLFELPARKVSDGTATPPAAVQGTLETQHKAILEALAARQSVWFDQEMEKLDHWAEDRRAGLKFDLKELDDEFRELKKQIRQTGNLPDKLALQRKARELEKKRDDAWRACDEAAKQIEIEKDDLLDRVEEQLAQAATTEDLFTITVQID